MKNPGDVSGGKYCLIFKEERLDITVEEKILVAKRMIEQ